MADLAAGEQELLAALAYGELSAFDRLAEDARLAPDLGDRVQVTRIAVRDFDRYLRVAERLLEFGVDPLSAILPYRRPLDEFHRLTKPKTWQEALLKAYLGGGLAADLHREVADLIGDATRALVDDLLAEDDEFLVDRIGAAIRERPDQAGRLALWGRRLVGEAMSQAQRVVADRPALTELFAASDSGLDLADIGRLFTRLIENHTARMKHLGLNA